NRYASLTKKKICFYQAISKRKMKENDNMEVKYKWQPNCSSLQSLRIQLPKNCPRLINGQIF
ncbi:MAG: hypothetical protein IJD40_14225, partial [Lachnospiraceae bacterium]|nr:hypothetical protein [Lachnospiraceae bacterium]